MNDTFSQRLIWSFRIILHLTHFNKNIMKTKITQNNLLKNNFFIIGK